MSEKQTKYIGEYNKVNYKMYLFRVRKDNSRVIKSS